MNKNMLYRSIPKVDVLLEDPEIQGLIETYSRDTVVESIHLEMDALRKYIGTCEDEEKAKEQIGNLNMNVRRTVTAMHTPNMRQSSWYRNDSSYEPWTSTDQPETHEFGSLRLQRDILIWNTIWKPEDAERDIHILKNCSVRLQVQRLQWR